MKKSLALIIAGGTVAGMIIGFLVGIAVKESAVPDDSVAGTITKVKKYRNTKVAEAEIRLQNNLVSDTASLGMLRRYFTFHYLDAIKLAGDIEKAVAEANSAEAFKASEENQIDGMNNFGLYLNSTRLYYLAALAAIRDPENTDAEMIRNSLNLANNIIAQKNYRTRTVLNFIDKTEAFMASVKPGEFPGLREAHDILALDLVNASVRTGDKMLQKLLGNKALLTDYRKLAWYDQGKTVKQVRQDAEKLGALDDVEKYQFIDAEKLGYAIVRDDDTKGIYFGAAEKMAVAFLDAERVGTIIADAEKLCGRFYDANELDIFIDAEKLGFFDAYRLGELLDAEKLGFIDAERLATLLDAEKLGVE